MIVRVKLFAIARDRAGRDELAIELPAGATVADLRKETARVFPALVDILSHAIWAVDTVYANESTVLQESSEIALIPPVSGG